MSNRLVLDLDDTLLGRIDAEKEITGTTRSGAITRILEKHFAEQQGKQEFYDEWFVAEVRRGLHSLETEPLYDHEDVMREAHELLETKRVNHAPKVV